MDLQTMLDNNLYERNFTEFFKVLKETELLIPFNGYHLVELYTDENKFYIPLYTNESEIKNNEHTRLDKVTIDIVIRDIFSNKKYHAISINPETHDFIMNRKMVDIYKKITNKGVYNMDFKVGLNIVAGKAASGKTSTIVNLVNLDSETKNVLFLSLETGFDMLIEKYNLSGKDSITLIDKPTSLNELDNELTNNKYDVVYIDYIMLLNTEPDTYESKINGLVELAKKHNIILVASDYLGINDTPDKYKEELFKEVSTIQILDMIL